MTNLFWTIFNIWAAAGMIVLAVYFIARAFCDKMINHEVRAIRQDTQVLKTESDLTKFLIHEKKSQ